MSDSAEDDPEWLDTDALEQARRWQSISPAVAERVIAMAENRARHIERMDWAKVYFQWACLLAALAAIVTFGIVAWHYADTGQPTQGLAAFALVAAGVASVFLGSNVRTAFTRKE